MGDEDLGADDDVVYEAGDINTVAGGGGGGAGPVDEFDGEDDDDLDDLDDGVDAEEGDGDEGDEEWEDEDEDALAGEPGEGNRVDEGNRATAGVSHAVLTFLARSLADEPDGVVVETEERRGTVFLRLSVAPGDMGRVIGRRGRTAQNIRTLVSVAGARDGIRTSVDIVDV